MGFTENKSILNMKKRIIQVKCDVGSRKRSSKYGLRCSGNEIIGTCILGGSFVRSDNGFFKSVIQVAVREGW